MPEPTAGATAPSPAAPGSSPGTGQPDSATASDEAPAGLTPPATSHSPAHAAGAHAAGAHAAVPEAPEAPAAAAVPDPPRARHRATRGRLPRVAPDLLWPLAALVAVVLVGARSVRGLPLPDDDALTAPAFQLLRGEPGLSPVSPEALGAVHTAVYATVTRAFQRHATLTGAGREFLLVLLLVSAVLVWRTARRCGLGNPAAAAAVLAFGAVPWLAPAHAVSTPAAVAVGWLLFAAWLLAAGRPAPAAWAVAALAGLLATLLAPDILLLVTSGLAGAVAIGWLRFRWSLPLRLLGAALLVAAAAVVRIALPRWDPQSADPARWSADSVGLLTVSAVLLGIGALTAWSLPRLRAAGIALAATTLLAVAPPSGRLPALLVCLPVAAVLLGALLERVVRAAVAERPAGARAVRVAAALAVAASVAAAAVSLSSTPRSDFGATARAGLVTWAGQQLPEGSRLVADPRTSAELVHAGADPVQVAGGAGAPTHAPVPAAGSPAVVLRVVSGAPPEGSAPIGRFDADDSVAPLTVVDPDPVAPTAEELDRRRVLGQALAANPDTIADDRVAAVLASGDLDPRLLSLLVGIGSQSGIGIGSLPVVPGEQGRTLVRQAVIESVGGTRLDGDQSLTDHVRALLRAQREPYTPDVVRTVPGGLLVGYRYVPDPDAVLTRAAP